MSILWNQFLVDILENEEFFDLLEPDFLGAKSEQMKLKILFCSNKGRLYFELN